MGFHLYLRPGELCRARWCHWSRPHGPRLGGNKGWTLALHLREEGTSSKVGEFDESVTIDQSKMMFLNRYIGRRYSEKKKRGQLDELVVEAQTEKYKSFSAAFHDVAKQLGLPQGAVVHQLRHSGPSVDRAMQRRPLQEVKRRGRWAADRSVKRYEKSGLVDRQLSALAPSVLAFCEEALLKVPEAFDQDSAPLLPDWVQSGGHGGASSSSRVATISKRSSSTAGTRSFICLPIRK